MYILTGVYGIVSNFGPQDEKENIHTMIPKKRLKFTLPEGRGVFLKINEIAFKTNICLNNCKFACIFCLRAKR